MPSTKRDASWQGRRSVTVTAVRIDHVIYYTRDLDAAAARLEARLGLAVLAGGRHDGLGTHNRIVPLGGGYLELLAVADADEAARSPLGAAVLARASQGDGLGGWAVVVDDVRPVAARLGTPISVIARSGFSAHLTGLAESIAEPYLPFFIARDDGSADPGVGAGAGGITWIEVAGDEARLREWLGGEDLPVRVVEGPPAVLAMGIGERELRAEG
jgi:catechol 2,3-dioxygenase-like lactoylglutathione lyase family enzyme